MDQTLKEAIKTVFLLQCLALLFVWVFFGMEYTKSVTIDSRSMPGVWLISRFIHIVPFTFHFPVILLLLFGVTFSPVIEELMYRAPFWFAIRGKRFQNPSGTSKLLLWGMATIVSVQFGMQHNNYALPWQFFTAFMGLSWTWLVIKHKRLWPTIFLHYVWNVILASIELVNSPHVHQELTNLITS